MSDLLAARSQMGMSLAFHIIFAAIGMAMPVFMVLAEWRWRKSGDAAYLELAKRWAKGTAILFAVGAVSGTVLAFELGLLWPRFMAWAGAIIGMPFSLEGFAFFLEAIFLGIYLYGWKRVAPGVHLLAGIVVALSGAASGIFVTIANAWMNTPVGFATANGRVVEVEPLAAMLNPAAFSECLHMIVAAYAATGLAVAGIHALMLLRGRNQPFHSRALGIALTVGGIASILQPFTGDVIARAVALNQPLKLAAFEAHYQTQSAAPLQVVGGLEIPAGLSLLAFHSRDAVVKGLEDFPRDQWPAVRILRPAFWIMVTAGFLAAAVACWAGIQLWWRHKPRAANRRLLWAVVCAAPLGFIAIEAGWTVTELGRQPWIIYGFMRTADAVTPMPGLAVPFAGFTLLYLLLAILVVWMLSRHIADAPREAGEEVDAVLR
jgi:cytochrome d ubiquinol oxidase subunit I